MEISILSSSARRQFLVPINGYSGVRELSFHLLPSQGWVSDAQTGNIQGSRAIPSLRFLYIEVLFLMSLIKVNCGNWVGVRGTPSGLPHHISLALSPRPRLSLFPLWPWEAQECRRYQSKIHSEMFYWPLTMCQVLLQWTERLSSLLSWSVHASKIK